MAALAQAPLYSGPSNDAIAKIIGDLYDRMLSDPRIWYYWKGHSDERKAAERQVFAELVFTALGWSTASRDGAFQTSHAPLGVSAVEGWVFVELAAAALDQSRLTYQDQESLFFALTRSKSVLGAVDSAPPAPLGFATQPQSLSQREREVLRLIALGKNNSEIAVELFISVNTVTRHVTNIFAKTSTNNRVQAAVYAARRRIV